MDKARVLIADDHQLVAAGLAQLLAGECDVVGTVSDATRLLSEIGRLRPDIVVQDLSMPPLTGIDVIRAIRRGEPSVQIIVVTMWDDSVLAAECFRAGACAYVLKNCATAELVAAVRCVVEGKTYVTPLIAGGMIHSLASPRPGDSAPLLTARQREILQLLAEGKSMKEAAKILNVAVRTVAFHKYRIMELLNIKTSAELVRFAVAQHIV
jgi:DNA-binding NarL/FixJ family response regulator